MNITIIGLGYAGLISAVGWAGRGHQVFCVDADPSKAAKISKGTPPIFEKGLEERLKKAISTKKLKVNSDYGSVPDSDIVLICVGTPSTPSGAIDLSYIRSSSRSMAKELENSSKFTVVAVRSTVVPGTTEDIVGSALEQSGKSIGQDVGLAMIPEFLKEGSALGDFDSPDRIVIGYSDEKTRNILAKLYEPFNQPKIFTDIKTAEMIKYASNSFLAARVSLVNEFANMCEKLGLDVDEVMEGVGMDKRIGPQFLVAGAGFGGSCFPKDVQAINHMAKSIGRGSIMLEAVLEVNLKQQLLLAKKLKTLMPLRGKNIAILGLTFKPDTDDVRDSPSIALIRFLLAERALVRVYDPEGMENMKKIFQDSQIRYAASWEDCIGSCDAAILLTAWQEFKKNASEYKKLIGAAPLLDAGRLIKKEEAEEAGLSYYCIGRGDL